MPRSNGQQGEQRREKLAANVGDLLRLPEIVRGAMRLSEKLSRKHFNADRSRIDEGAVEFTCPLLTAACLLDFIRARDRELKQCPTRAYLCRATAWIKLSSDAVLSVVEDGEVRLNPAFFPEEFKPVAMPLRDDPQAVLL